MFILYLSQSLDLPVISAAISLGLPDQELIPYQAFEASGFSNYFIRS